MNNFPIQHGLKPIRIDHRNYSFPRTFGALSPITLPDDYNCDAGLTMPDQNADGRPEGCVWYTTTELCNDEDGVAYDVSFVQRNVLFMENQSNGPCSIEDGLKSTIVYGVRIAGIPDGEAVANRRGQYFQLEMTDNLDWFDAVRSTLYLNRLEKRSVSVGTLWMSEFEDIGSNGIIPGDFAYIGNPAAYPSHNWKICGWKTIAGIPYLIGKTWQGTRYGDAGWAYFPRTAINKALSIKGTGAFTIAKADSQNIQIVELTVFQLLLSYYYRLAGVLGLKV